MKLTFDISMQGCKSVLLCCSSLKKTGTEDHTQNSWLWYTLLEMLTHYLNYTLLILLIEFMKHPCSKEKMHFTSITPFIFVPFFWSVVRTVTSSYFNGKNLTRKDPLYLMWINSFYEEYLHQLKNKPSITEYLCQYPEWEQQSRNTAILPILFILK